MKLFTNAWSRLAAAVFLLLPLCGWGQTIFTETFGTPTGTTAIGIYATGTAPATFSTKPLGYTYGSAGAANPADIRITTVSSGYTGASGGGNAFFTTLSGAGEYGFTIGGINASAATGLTLNFGLYKQTAAAFTFLVDYATDGATFVNVPVSGLPSAGAASGWYLVSGVSLPVGAQSSTLTLRFRKQGAVSLRLDDVVLSGATAPVAPVVTTTAPATAVTAVSATLGGNITTLGSPAPTANGVVYSINSTNGTPQLLGTGVTAVAAGTTATATGAYTVGATGLAAGTTYAYQAYVTNSGGTVYGGVQTFATPTPAISATPGSLALGSTPAGTASSPAQTYALSGTNLTGNLTLTAPTGVEISQTSATAGFAGSLTVTASGTLASTTIYVRIAAAASVGPVSGNVTNAGGGATPQNVTLSGTVSTPSGAVVTATPASLSLGTVATNTAGPISTYSVSGNTLGTTPITVTAPAGVELSLNGFVTSAATTLSLTPTAGSVASTTVSVRIAAAAAPALISGNITNASGAGAANVAVSGAVASAATACLAESFDAVTFPPVGWLRSSTTDVTRSTAAADVNTGAGAAAFGGTTGTFTTPSVANPNLLTFFLGTSTNANPKQFQVSVSTTSQTAGFAPVALYSSNTTGGTVLTNGVYAQFTVDLSAFNAAPAVWIQFAKINSSTASPFRFDDVAVSCGTAPPFLLATGSPSVAAPYCVGQSPTGDVSFNLPYTVSGGSFGAGNVFTAFLSDATGSFATNKKAVGTLAAVSSGTVPVVLAQFSTPFVLTTSANYRLRVEASTPATVGTDNGSNLAVASYLDNEATAATALPGNGAATLSFAAPATCVTNVVVTLKAGSAFGVKPLAGTTYAANAAFGSGTDLGGGQFVVYNGPATGSVSVTGLTNDTQYAFGVFTTNGGPTGTTGYSNGVLRTVRPVAPATLAEVLVPQLISGRPTTGSTHTSRLPYVWRVSIGNLTAGATYKYYTAARASTDVPGYGGVGIPIETKTAGGFVRGTAPSFGGSGSTLVADASGNYSGWFAFEPSADTRFNDGNTVFPMVVLNDGLGGNVESQFLATTSPVTARLLGGGAAQATAVRGNSFGTPSNFVLTYDNPAGTGRPLAGTYLEAAGTAAALPTANYPGFYTASVAGTAGAYGLLTPNANANGIQRVEQRALADGILVGCPATDADGTWPGGAATASPSTGTTAKVLTTGDTPFAAPTAGTISPANQQTGQTITITGTNFGSSPNPVVTFAGGATATAATVNAAGTSLTVVVPAAATTGPLSIATSCGAAATTAGNLTVVPLVFYSVTGATDLSLLASFTANADGSAGLTPPSFANPGQTFNILGTGRSFAANWTVSGTGAKVVLTAGASLTIPTGAVLSATLDQAANSTLVIQNAASAAVTSLNQGAQDASSTIELAQTGAVYTIPADPVNGSGSFVLNYANLRLSGGSKRIPTKMVVNGSLTFENTAISGAALNSAVPSASQYPTVQLFGDFNQLAGVSYDAARSITLHLMNLTAVQNLNGNGNTIALYRLYTAALGSGVGAGDNPAALGGRLTGSGSVLQVANSLDGGLALYESTASLALDAGTTLRFAPGGGGNFFVNTDGVLKPDPLANLEFFRNTVNTFSLGTLRLAPGFTTVNNFLLNSVAAGANTLTLTSDLTVNGTATIQAGTLVIGANTLTLNGLLSNATGGFLNGSTSSNLVVGGTGAFGTLAFASGARLLNNLTMSRNGGTLTLAAPLVVGGTLALTNGVVGTTAANLLTLTNAGVLAGGSAASYINGPLARGTTTGAATVGFPVGNGADYRPITLNTVTQTSSTTYTAEVLAGTARTTAVTAPLTRVSAVRYFRLDPSATPSGYSGTVTLSFDTDDLVNQPADASFVMAKRPSGAGGPWVSAGRTGATSSGAGPYLAGTLESGPITGFSEFSLASTAPASNNAGATSNPLPVELLSFSARRTAAGPVALAWATASERNSARFDIERSLDGRAFERVGTVAAQGTKTTPTTYAYLDEKPTNSPIHQPTYYRLRQVDADGSDAYSAVRSVAGAGKELACYPNPARTVLFVPAAPGSRYRVLSLVGQALLGGEVASALAEVPVAALPPGTYLLELTSAAGRQVQRFTKE